MDMTQQIEVLAKEYLSKVTLDFKLVLTEDVVTASCGYHFLFGWNVLLNPKAILKSSLIRRLNWRDYLEMVMAHEMGHIITPEYEDWVYELEEEETSEGRKSEIRYLLEYRAWKNGLRFVSIQNRDVYNEINERYVRTFAIAS